ncbi:hypothetical protein [Microbacterium paludicola]|uniref:DUF7882 domain-containing protein n=1 Tax=Microbacterium paludicola TaxID=300019 RepID=A0A4Y9FUL4_9MICO|nr:hypothetical protein [Microbacterium paludicola]MBF0816397.1 hypothetical protein [Microbacterium paludicola]TFU32932.1 hypothetical protein E4U02_08240 [Microbacterium paludicola]
MGILHYGTDSTPIHIADRALAHLKVVVVAKLRRQESFTVSWQHHAEDGQGRSTIWLHPSIPVRFEFDEPVTPELNREWIEELAHSANALGGITLVSEHVESSEDRGQQVEEPAA